MSLFFAGGIYIGFLFRTDWILCIFLFGCIAAAVACYGKRKVIAWVLIGFFFGGVCAYFIAQGQGDAKAGLTGSEVEIAGEVLSVSQTEERASLTVKTDQFGKVLVGIYKKNPDYTGTVGKRIRLSGLLELPASAGNPGGFDYRMYLRSIGIFSVMQTKPDQVSFSAEQMNRILHGIALFRHDFEAQLSQTIGKRQSGLASAMLFGDKSGMEEDQYESFQRNGTAHILSVSGLHVGFLYGILVFLLGGKRKPVPNIIILIILIFYGVLSGFCPAVTRALLMIGLHILSKTLCRPYDLLSSTGMAAIILLIQNPYALFNTGFQLSFFAVVLMAWIFPIFARNLPRDTFLAVLLPMPALQAAMAPYTAYLFNYFSFGAFVANFGVVFFSGILIPAGLAAMLASPFPGPVFDFAATFVDVCIRCVLWCNQLTYADGKTCLNVTSPSVFLLILFYGIFFFFLSEGGWILWQRKKYKIIAALMVFIVASAGLLEWKTDNRFDCADAVFVDVGQGDCLHIRTPSGKNVLIDGGGKESFDIGKRVLKPYLLKNGVRKIDLAVITHLDIDHYGGIRSLAAEGMVDSLGLYKGNQLIEPGILKDTGLEQDQLLYLSSGDRVDLDSYVWLEVLYPAKKTGLVYESELLAKEENPRSLVIRVHLGGYRILMTGDIDIKTEDEVLSLQRQGSTDADVLKIGHHGSKYSTSDEFLQAVNPRIAVFQTGKNNYGHPDPSILEKCREKGIMIYRTDKDGAIGLFGFYKNKDPYLRTFRKGT